MSGDGFVDWRGRRFEPDPSGRHRYRMIYHGEWSEYVTASRRGKVDEDPDGLTACASAPVPGTSEHIAESQKAATTIPDGGHPWEYKIVSATFGDKLERLLNKMGAAGWEVVSISAANGTMTLTGNKIFALMKRALPVVPVDPRETP